MHPISFAFKRAHLSCVAFGANVVRRIKGMTPAAFDLMFAVRTNLGPTTNTKGTSTWSDGIEQRRLWRALGLHPSTVSKLLKRLRLLGWICNDARMDRDGRVKKVRLTVTGRRRIDRAMRIVFQQHTHWREFETFFKRGCPLNVLEDLEDFEGKVRRIARHFRDFSRDCLYAFDYYPDKPIPLYIERDWWREERRDVDAYDCTTYRGSPTCALARDREWAIETTKRRKVRLTSSVSRRRRCLVTIARVPDRPESRLVIEMLQRCAYDDGAYERTCRRHDRERQRERAAREHAQRMADPWFAAFEEARDTEARFRAGDPNWKIPRDLLEMMEELKGDACASGDPLALAAAAAVTDGTMQERAEGERD